MHQMSIEDLQRALYRLGERVERAEMRLDIDVIVWVDRQLEIYARAYPEIWIEPIVIAGQNNIRKVHHLEELHV